MTRPERALADQPFPGAHSQVPGAHNSSATSMELLHSQREGLPVEADCSSVAGGWVVRQPVRTEQVTVATEVVVYERVLVRRRRVGEIARIETEVRREELRASTEGEANVRETR